MTGIVVRNSGATQISVNATLVRVKLQKEHINGKKRMFL
jgi:hypothetical protein